MASALCEQTGSMPPSPVSPNVPAASIPPMLGANEFAHPTGSVSAAASAAAAAIRTGSGAAFDGEIEREASGTFLLRPRGSQAHRMAPLPGQYFKAMSTAASPVVHGRLPDNTAATAPGTPLVHAHFRAPAVGGMALGPARPDRSLSPRASGAGTGGTVGRSQDSLTQAGTGAAEAREAAWRQREEELKAQVLHLEKEKKEVEHRLDDDGRQFLEALISLESEVSRLTKQNKQLDAERKEALERLNVQETDFKLQLEEVERHRDHLLEVMTEEGQELQSRMEKLNGDNQKLSRDKESLTMDLAKAVARADVVVARTPPNSGKVLPDQEQQIRSLRNQCEELKDEVTNQDGEIVLLRSQIEIVQRKLKLTDMENGMLKSELSVHRQGSSGGPT